MRGDVRRVGGRRQPMRHGRVLSTCLAGGHGLWWQVHAAHRSDALALLPTFVAARTEAIEVREIEIP